MKFEFMPRYTKYLCWYQTEVTKERSSGFMALVSLAVFVTCIFLFKGCSEEVQVYKAHYRPEELKMIEVFRKHGSDQPEAMAVAVHKTKNPPLMAAIAIKESNGRPKAVGDSGASKGAFQVQNCWGVTPHSATEQALQAEKIFNHLLAKSNNNWYTSLRKYNGGTRPPKRTAKYADRVLALEKEIRYEVRAINGSYGDFDRKAP